MITKEKYQELKTKYGGYATWAIWDDNDQENPDIIDKNIDILNADVVMIGFNLSSPMKKPWSNFRRLRHAHDRKLWKTFNHSSYRGAYMTDFIKGTVEVDSKKVKDSIKSGEINLDEHINFFKQEMKNIGVTENTLYILFGRKVERVFLDKLDNDDMFKHYIYCKHYSARGTDKEWIQTTSQDLIKYCKKHNNVKGFRESIG